MIWPRNHTSHTKVYFNEFVANVLRDDIGIVVFDLRGHGGQKHPSGAKKGMEELIYQKKYIMRVSQQPQKSPSGTNQILAATSIKPKPQSAVPKKPGKRDS